RVAIAVDVDDVGAVAVVVDAVVGDLRQRRRALGVGVVAVDLDVGRGAAAGAHGSVAVFVETVHLLLPVGVGDEGAGRQGGERAGDEAGLDEGQAHAGVSTGPHSSSQRRLLPPLRVRAGGGS